MPKKIFTIIHKNIFEGILKEYAVGLSIGNSNLLRNYRIVEEIINGIRKNSKMDCRRNNQVNFFGMPERILKEAGDFFSKKFPPEISKNFAEGIS